jgi:hypothetical protein
MTKKRKIAISPLVPKDNIKQNLSLATPVLIWERPPSQYNPIIIIDDIEFIESEKPL